ncbi:MAG: PAS domain-containing protein [Alphaproteobacteria bacterium]
MTDNQVLRLPDAIGDERLRRLYAYWDGLRRGRRYPTRREVDPLQLPFILGNLLLIEVMPGRAGFRVRLHGTALAERIGMELTGRLLDDHPDEAFRRLAARTFAHVSRVGDPFGATGDRVAGADRHPYETLILPLSDDGKTVDTLLVGLVYTTGPIPITARERLFPDS